VCRYPLCVHIWCCCSFSSFSSFSSSSFYLKVSYIATQTYKNGVLQSHTYGTNNLAKTWDYNKIYTCLCDRTTYHGPLVGAVGTSEGYDCSIRRCPTGDDPYTNGQLFEVQAIKCTGTGGTLTFSFRSETTTAIAYNAAASVVEEALEVLTQIKTLYGVGVTVTYSSGSALCTSGGSNIASVTFTQALGDLPILVAGIGSLTGSPAVIVTEITKGTKESVECSQRGLCNYDTGICGCTYGHTSSDGAGNGGSRGDCGHVNPFQTDVSHPAATEAAAST